MKRALIFLALLCLVSSCLAQEIKWFEGSFKQGQKAAEKENKLILIDYFTGSG